MGRYRQAEYIRLDDDHPEWKVLDDAEIRARYWMYFRDDVAMARAVAYWRRLIAPVATLVEWLNRKLAGKQPGLTQNPTHASDRTQVGTTGRLDVKTAQTGAQHTNERQQ